MKNFIKYILQKTLSYRGYLMLFAHYKIATLKKDKKECDFFYFLQLVKKPTAVLDIGANIGIMTVHLSKRYPDATIHSFEPMPDNLDILKRVIKKYKLKNIELHPTALGNEVGKVKMILPQKGNAKMQGLSHVVHDTITDWNEGEEVEVECTTLDTIFSSTDVQGIKLDVENFEYFVLLGGKNLIERCRPVVYTELWNNQNRTNCFDFFAGLNYRPYVVNQDNLVVFNPDVHQHQNFIFLPLKQ